jgi:hypothetical protein
VPEGIADEAAAMFLVCDNPGHVLFSANSTRNIEAGAEEQRDLYNLRHVSLRIGGLRDVKQGKDLRARAWCREGDPCVAMRCGFSEVNWVPPCVLEVGREGMLILLKPQLDYLSFLRPWVTAQSSRLYLTSCPAILHEGLCKTRRGLG